MIKDSEFKNLGFGLGLRSDHFDDIGANPGRVDWFEALADNYMGAAGIGFGPKLETLLQIRKDYPIAFHSVGLSIGSTDPLDWKYLQRYQDLIDRISPEWVSDHLCWTGVDGIHLHDLLPLPYTKTVIDHVVERINAVQDFLGRRILIENVSSYVEFKNSEMPEWEFVKEIATQSGCGLLLDINNVYVSAFNHGFDPKTYLESVPMSHVAQIHLAGHTNKGDFLVDTHSEKICDPVWKLFRDMWPHIQNKSIMIERDDNIPSYLELVDELEYAKKLVSQPLRKGRPLGSERIKDSPALV